MEEAVPAKPKKLVVLDVNGFLVHRTFRLEQKDSPYAPDALLGEFSVYVRPGAREFLKHLFSKCDVAVWATARKDNLDPIVEMLFTEEMPVAVFDQRHVTLTDVLHPSKPGKPVWVKEMRTVFCDPRILRLDINHDASTTIIMDDSPYKTAWNPDFTSVFPSTWSPWEADDGLLKHGSVLYEFLEEFADAADGRDVVRAAAGKGILRGEYDSLLQSVLDARPDAQKC